MVISRPSCLQQPNFATLLAALGLLLIAEFYFFKGDYEFNPKFSFIKEHIIKSFCLMYKIESFFKENIFIL
jgi:hypothetical protein